MKKTAAVFKALGDPARVEIVSMLQEKELCVCDILDAFAVSQPTISHHLRILKQAGLVNDKREGKWIYYSLNPDVLKIAAEFLDVAAAKSAFSVRSRTCAEGGACKGGADDNE